MTEREDGGSAFPLLDYNGHTLVCREFGMTMRDYFAGQWIAAGNHGNLSPRDMAEQAYEAADAMLEARK